MAPDKWDTLLIGWENPGKLYHSFMQHSLRRNILSFVLKKWYSVLSEHLIVFERIHWSDFDRTWKCIRSKWRLYFRSSTICFRYSQNGDGSNIVRHDCCEDLDSVVCLFLKTVLASISSAIQSLFKSIRSELRVTVRKFCSEIWDGAA